MKRICIKKYAKDPPFFQKLIHSIEDWKSLQPLGIMFLYEIRGWIFPSILKLFTNVKFSAFDLSRGQCLGPRAASIVW